MSAQLLEDDQLACPPMGALDDVVECLEHGRSEKQFVVRPPTPSAHGHNPYFDLLPA